MIHISVQEPLAKPGSTAGLFRGGEQARVVAPAIENADDHHVLVQYRERDDDTIDSVKPAALPGVPAWAMKS